MDQWHNGMSIGYHAHGNGRMDMRDHDGRMDMGGHAHGDMNMGDMCKMNVRRPLNYNLTWYKAHHKVDGLHLFL